MEKQRALDLLETYLQEIEHLRTLHYDNDERRLWVDKVNAVLEAAFGKDSGEYEKFNARPSIVVIEDTEAFRQKRYQDDLRRHELGIKSVLQKYEIVGIPVSREAVPEVKVTAKAKAEPPKAFIAHGGKNPARDKLE